MESSYIAERELIIRTAELMAAVEALADIEKENQRLKEQLSLAELKLTMRDKIAQINVLERVSLN